MSGFEGRDAIAAYLSSKGLPMTGENVRRALEQNASNPGLIKGLVNQAPPPPDEQGGAAPTSNQRGSAAAGLSQRMHQAAPQSLTTNTGTTQPQAISDSAMAQPLAAGSGSNALTSLVQAILGGGAGIGLSHLLMGGRGSPQPMPQYNIPMPGGDPMLGGAPQLPAPQAALPAPQPSPVGGPAQVGGPAAMPQISDKNMVGEGVNPIGPPQPGRMQPGPSTPIPLPQAPVGAAPASNVASGAPVSIIPRQAGADAADLGGHMDWAKILGDIGHTIGRR